MGSRNHGHASSPRASSVLSLPRRARRFSPFPIPLSSSSGADVGTHIPLRSPAHAISDRAIARSGAGAMERGLPSHHDRPIRRFIPPNTTGLLRANSRQPYCQGVTLRIAQPGNTHFDRSRLRRARCGDARGISRLHRWTFDRPRTRISVEPRPCASAGRSTLAELRIAAHFVASRTAPIGDRCVAYRWLSALITATPARLLEIVRAGEITLRFGDARTRVCARGRGPQ